MRVEIQLPQAIVNRYATETTQAERREWWKFQVEVLAFLALVFYAGISALQWREMKAANRAVADANTQTREAVANTERPWVGIDHFDVIGVEEGKTGGGRLAILNSGKTPALGVNVTTYVGIWSGPMPEGPPRDTFPIKYNARPVIFPNQTIKQDCVVESPLSAESIKSLNEGKSWIIIWGSIEYNDRWNRTHKTSVCAFYGPSVGGFGFCARGNDAT